MFNPVSNWVRGISQLVHPEPPKDKACVSSPSFHAREFKESMSRTLSSGAQFEQTSAVVIEKLESQCPNETAALQQVMETYPEMMKELKELGWTGLKNKYKDEMKQAKENGMSFEELRKLLVEASIELSLAAVREMGYPEPGSHAAFGTPGWPSDVDTTYFRGKGVSHEVEALEKLMFDAIVLGHLGSLPGQLLDTESYIGQKGGNFEIEDKMKSQEGKQTYNFVELTLATTQIVEGKTKPAGHPTTEKSPQTDFDVYKTEQLINAEQYSSEYKNSLDEVISDVEGFKKQTNFEIDELAVKQYMPDEPLPLKGTLEYEATIQKLALKLKTESPDKYRKAAVSYRGRALIGLSVGMDENLKQIDKLNAELRKAHDDLDNLMKMKNPITDAPIKSLQEKIANLKVKLEKTQIEFFKQGGLRNLCFDEGYITYGALIVVVAKKGGQGSQRVLDKAGKSAEERLAQPGIHSLSFTQEQKKGATPQELVSSQQENLGFYQNHFEHDKADQSATAHKKSFVKNSKYADRICSATNELLKHLTQKTLPEHTPAGRKIEYASIHGRTARLHDSAKTLSFQASEVEKCKRRAELNATAGTLLLQSEFERSLKNELGSEELTPELKEQLKEDAASIANLFQLSSDFSADDLKDLSIQEKNGLLGRFEADYIKKTFSCEERYNILMSKAIDHVKCNIVSTEPIILTDNARLNTIIRGLAGFPIVKKEKNSHNQEIEVIDRELDKLFTAAEAMTLETFQLHTVDAIKKFNSDLAELSHEVRDLSFHVGVVASPSNRLGVGNLQSTWQKAITTKQ